MNATASVTEPLLVVDDLSIHLRQGDGVVKGVSLQLSRGEVLGLVGESGSGKTTLGLALLGQVRPGLAFGSGRILLGGIDVVGLRSTDLAAFRREQVAYVPQDPASALNPALRIQSLLLESLPRQERSIGRLQDLLEEVALPTTAAFLASYPHQLSGGQQQRVAIAAAFARRPQLIVLDEPTTALDVTTQRHVLETVKRLCKQHAVAAVYISHDLAVVSSLASRIAVMRRGRLVEIGSTTATFAKPQHPYTQALLAAVPDLRAAASATAAAEVSTGRAPVLTLAGVTARHGSKVVFSDLDLVLPERACLALVGESGSGKTTLARCITGLHGEATGAMRFRGTALPFEARRRSGEARRQIQYVFQNPYGSLNPKRTIGASIAVALQQFERLPASDVARRVREALDQVALSAAYSDRFPHQLSGGQRQRAAIARALILKPEILVCDEITSALDVSVQAVVIDLLKSLQRDSGLTILFVTHNLALVAEFAHDVVVMHGGRIVERGGVQSVLSSPQAPETRRLIEDTPRLLHSLWRQPLAVAPAARPLSASRG